MARACLVAAEPEDDQPNAGDDPFGLIRVK
jgi:hypothetical protein